MPNICPMYRDPEITVEDALALYGGNQSKLASALGVNRSSVCQWVKEGREFVPTIQAYRLKQLHPDVTDTAA